MNTHELSLILDVPHFNIVASMKRRVESGLIPQPKGIEQHISGHRTTVYELDDRSAMIVVSRYGALAVANTFDALVSKYIYLPELESAPESDPAEPESSSRRATVEAVMRKTGGKFDLLPLSRWCAEEGITPKRENGYFLWPVAAWQEAYEVDLSELFPSKP